MTRAIRIPTGGRDGWGEDLILVKGAGDDYLLISKGADRTLDVPDPSAYWSAIKENVRGNENADLVFRNGRAVRMAPH
jgi:hypothetical protein